MSIPRVLIAGDSYIWLDNFADYPVAEWRLMHLIRGAENKLDIPAVVVGNAWQSTIASEESALFSPGKYWVQIQVAQPDNRITLDTIELTVKPNFADLNTYDGRSDDEKELEAVSLAIVDISNKGISEYQIKGRQVVYQDLSDLIRLRDRLRARIAKAKNNGKSRNSYVSFR